MSGPVGRQPDFFGVKLDGSGVYFGGQTVTGKVILQTDEELTNIKLVTVKLKGEGDVHWTERVCRFLIYVSGLLCVLIHLSLCISTFDKL